MEDNSNLENKPKLKVRGLEFTVVTDASCSPLWEIELDHGCPNANISVHMYGGSRQEALDSAVRELSLLVVNHQSRCYACHANIIYSLIGIDGLEPGQKGDRE